MSLLLMLLACDGVIPLAGEVESTEISNVLRVNWEAPANSHTWVVWWSDQGISGEVEGDWLGGEDWEALLMTGGGQVSYEIFVDGEGIGTGFADAGNAELPVAIEEQEGGFHEPVLTTLQNDMEWVPVLLDSTGVPRWWRPPNEPRGLATQAISLRARAVDDGIWLNTFDTDPSLPEAGLIELVGWDGTVLESIDAPYHHHDFVVHDDGSLVWIAFSKLPDSQGEVRYTDVLMHRAPDGETTVLADLAELLPMAMNGPVGMNGHVTWANHLEFDGERYWLSLHNLDTIAVLDTDGELIGTFGAVGAEGPADWSPDQPFSSQHGGTPTPAGTLLVFDNNGGPGGVRVMEYDLGAETEIIDTVWSLEAPEPNWESIALGDARRTAYGTTAVSWGVFGVLEEVDDVGVTGGHVAFEEGSFVGFLSTVKHSRL